MVFVKPCMRLQQYLVDTKDTKAIVSETDQVIASVGGYKQGSEIN